MKYAFEMASHGMILYILLSSNIIVFPHKFERL
jgi:hypothetical protein